MRLPISRLLIVALGVCLLPSCSWFQPDPPVRYGVVSLQLNKAPPKGKTKSYAVAQVHKGSKLKSAGFQPLSKEGTTAFVLPMGHLYDIRVFYDLNRNQAHDANEPSGLVQNVAPAPSSSAFSTPLTMAFGVSGPIATTADRTRNSSPAPEQQQKEVPAEAQPYMKYVPQWVQDKLLE